MAERQRAAAADDRESDWGIPIPGLILPEAQWAKTALKQWPSPPLDIPSLFGANGPLVLDLGCGNGRFTLSSALARPDWLHLAIDALPVVVRYATRRANQRGLHRVRVGVLGAHELLQQWMPAASAREIHCYHPQPYYQRWEMRRRLITPHFLRLVHRTLEPGGVFVLQTDNPAYASYMRTVLPAFFQWTEHPERWSDAPQGRTRREILALRERLPVFRAICTPLLDLTEDELERRSAALPLPTFDADRRLARFDRLEQGRPPDQHSQANSRPSPSRNANTASGSPPKRSPRRGRSQP
jgi:tRNA (guanine-N7-)-methyltransferase